MKSFVLAIVMVLFLLASPAVNGLSATATIGTDKAASSIGMYYGSGKGDIVDQKIKMNPLEGTISNSWYFTGPGSTYRSTYGYYGGYAKSTFSVSGPYAQTWYDFALSSYPYASVSESLTSRYASNIYASGYASSNRGTSASGYINVYSPANNAYLNNYRNNAYGTYSSAKFTQSGYASANSYYGSIATDMKAANYWDRSEVYAKQYYYPVLYYYPYGWYATAYSDSSNTYAQQGFYGYGWPVYTSEYAKKYGWTPNSYARYPYGWHALGQDAYTGPTSQGVKYPIWR